MVPARAESCSQAKSIPHLEEVREGDAGLVPPQVQGGAGSTSRKWKLTRCYLTQVDFLVPFSYQGSEGTSIFHAEASCLILL